MRILILYLVYILSEQIESVKVKVTGGTFIKYKYMEERVILSYDKIGPQMCIKDCLLYKDCNAVNFWRNQLRCDLLQVLPSNNHTFIGSQVYFSNISDWKIVSYFGIV